MATRVRYTGVVSDVEEARTGHAAFEILRLREIADADGSSFRGAPDLTCGAQVRRLDLRPREAALFVAHIEELDADRTDMGGADAPERRARPAKLSGVETRP